MAPSVPEDPIDTWIEKQTPVVRPVIRRLRQIVTATLPELPERLDRYGVIRYGGTKMTDWVCYISGHAAHANLGFARGSSLPDPEGIVEGTGKSLRHVKVHSLAEADRPAIERLLQAAGRLAS